MTYYSGQTDLEYYPSGTIKSYITLVSDEFQIGGQFIKAAERTQITFYASGAIKSLYLADDTKLVAGRISRTFLENEKVDFLEDGTLKLDPGQTFTASQNKSSESFFEAALKLIGI